MLRVNNNNLINGYIKQMLHDFNLPKAKVLVNGIKVFKDSYYVDGDYIYKATKTAVYGADFTSTEETYSVGDKQVPYLLKIDNYFYGSEYLNITKNLELRTGLYDSYIHSYLGDYLRFYRDFKHIDLMSMYNCFAGDVAHNIHISIKSEGSNEFNTDDGNYAIYLVPVKFYQTYTIAVDCDTSVELGVCLYDNNKVSLQTECEETFFKKTYAKVSGVKFNSPYKYEKLENILDKVSGDLAEKLYTRERELKLMIKLPITNASSLTVLEGDFTNSATLLYNNEEFSWDMYKDTEGQPALPVLDWFTLNLTTGLYTRVIDSNEAYYQCDSSGVIIDDTKPDLFLKAGCYYTTKAEDAEVVYIDLNSSYQLFNNTAAAVGFSAHNYDNTSSNRKYNSKLQLLYVNDGVSYLFANKLIGYLIENVITSDDVISDNIRRVQKAFYYRKNPTRKPNYNKAVDGVKNVGYDIMPKHPGIWSPELREMTYDLLHDEGVLNTAFDAIGWVDKDAEKVLGEDVNYDVGGHSMSGGIRR